MKMGSMKNLGRPWIHQGVMCDACEAHPIMGHRMKCETCADHDLCLRCFTKMRSAQEQAGCKFLEIQVDSSKFCPPFQIRYCACNECRTIPIQGRRYRHKWRPNYDLCSDCFTESSEAADNFEEMEETKIDSLCQTYCPVHHFHKQCMQCGQEPIIGPRFDSITNILTGAPGGEDDSLCLVCFDAKFTKETIKVTDYERVERPEADHVVHITMLCCLQCGETPICGPAFVNTRVPNDSLCLQCYQHMDPARWQYDYKRVEPPLQYGEPPLQYGEPPSQRDPHVSDLKQEYEILLQQLENSKISSTTSESKDSRTGDDDIDKLDDRLNSAVMGEKPNVKWDDVAGLESAKQALQEAVVFPIKYPHFFEGDRKPWNAFLLYGPPGTGKSYLAKAVATEVSSTFFSISSSDLLSKWLGESEKLVSQLFKKARKAAPSVIFIDEIDSIAGTRGEEAHKNGVKTEILVQMQGVGNNNDKVLVLAATNLPYNLDQALRRRFDKRIYIPLPEHSARKEMFKIHLKRTPHSLTDTDFEDLAARTPGFSGSDISVCVKDVLWAPLRKIQTSEFFRCDKQNIWYPCEPHEPGAVKTTMKQLEVKNLASQIKPLPISRMDFDKTLVKQRPTVSQADLVHHQKFTKEFGEEGTTIGEEQLSNGDQCSDKLDGTVDSVIVKENPNVKWSEVAGALSAKGHHTVHTRTSRVTMQLVEMAGLESAKQALHEAVVLPITYPHFFTGNRKPWRSFLLYGPPGTGKSYLAKAVATELHSTFFSISSADLGSKWHGDSEKLLSSLFQTARKCAPSIIFIDEIDCICGQWVPNGSSGSEAIMRVKTEMLAQMQGVSNETENVLILAATNLPYSLDPAIRRRFDKFIHIPLPEHAARAEMFRLHLGHTPHWLTDQDFDELAWRTPGFSGSDIADYVKSVLFEPIRKVQAAWFFKQVASQEPPNRGQQVWTPCDQYESGAYATTLKDLEAKGWGDKIQLPPIVKADFETTFARQSPTVSHEDLELHLRFTHEFGEQG